MFEYGGCNLCDVSFNSVVWSTYGTADVVFCALAQVILYTMYTELCVGNSSGIRHSGRALDRIGHSGLSQLVGFLGLGPSMCHRVVDFLVILTGMTASRKMFFSFGNW